MSKSLLKKSLSIVEEGLSNNKKSKEKDVPTIKKEIKRNHQLIDRSQKKPAKKLTINDIRGQRESKNKLVEDNLKKLLILSKPTAKICNSKKIIKRAHTGRYIIEKKKKVEQESLFTEEDFAAFEKELAKTIT